MTDELKVTLTDEGMVLNGTITNPDIVKFVRESDDPEEALRYILRNGSTVLKTDGSFGSGKRTPIERPSGSGADGGL